jgi:hypothetical protein
MAALALIAALSACTANGGSIYATIESEKKINVSTLNQLLTIIDLVNVPTAPLPYFVAAGAVYNGTVADANNSIGWPTVGADPVAVAPPGPTSLCTALTYFPVTSSLYGGFFTSSGSGMGVYSSSAASPGFLTALTDPLVSGQQITLLQTANVSLFAVVATPAGGTSGFNYSLAYSGNGTTFLPGTPLTDPKKKITGVAYFAGNTTYYMTSGSTLYSGPAPNSLVGSTSIGTFPIDGGDELRGVTVDNGYILIPSKNGAVYYSNDGTNWSRASTGDQVSGSVVGFLTVSTRVGTTGPVFLVGADGAGFYTLNVGSGTLSKFSDVTVTGLYAGAVRRILVDLTNNPNTVFFGAAGTGLWRANFDPATGFVNSSWIHE